MALSKRVWTGVVLGAVVAAAVVLVTPSVASAESNGGTRIMPLGDSITHGWNVSGGYRNKLWQHIQTDGYTVDFVGPSTDGPATLGDRDHAGYPGNRIDQISYWTPGWLSTYTPRTVLLHLGTNDIQQNYSLDQAPARLSTLIDKIRTGAPNADIFVATIIPFADAAKEAKAQTFNAAIPGIVSSKGSKVHLVNMRPAITTADLADGVHPSATGYDKMADVWYAALRAVPAALGPQGAIGTPRSYRLGSTNLCLDVYGATSQPLTRTVAWGCHGNANQKWTRTAAGELRVYGSNCLDVYGGATAAGSRVVIYPCHGGTNQRWTHRTDGTLLNARSGRCAATSNGSTAQGSEIVLADCSTATTQRWTAH
jgi:lysophospholipase L1-like esterase